MERNEKAESLLKLKDAPQTATKDRATSAWIRAPLLGSGQTALESPIPA